MLNGFYEGNEIHERFELHDAGMLANRLNANPSLRDLNLAKINIDAAGTRALSEALKVNLSLVKLNLNDNHIGDIGAQAVAEALEVNTSLTELKLWGNQIGGIGAYAIAEALKVNTSLSNLSLWHNQIGDAGAQAIAEALKVNTSLATLNLWHNQVGDAGAQAVAEALKVNNSVTDLTLEENLIGDTGARAIAEALKVNSSLKKLSLAFNRFCDAVPALAEAMVDNTSLTEFLFDWREVDDDGVQALSTALRFNFWITDVGLDHDLITWLLRRNRSLKKSVEGKLAAFFDATSETLDLFDEGRNAFCEVGRMTRGCLMRSNFK